jgi:hypothetical protein
MSLLLATDFAPEALLDWAEQLREALPGETVLTQRSPEMAASRWRSSPTRPRARCKGCRG